jgi:serine/threonine-protein kinase ULK/ATG1
MSKNKKIGKYTLTNVVLGTGQFATVYEGYHEEDKTQVAIKVMDRKKIESNEKLVRSLDLEVSMSQKICHPNVVRVFALYKSRRSYFLVMERCYGGDLKEFMEVNGVSQTPLPEIIARKFLRDIANGLKIMLENNIIHRDLKPANLLLDRQSRIDLLDPLNGIGTLKIADFGLAREIIGGEMAQTTLGSPNYMAPEIMEGKAYDGKADLFSCGDGAYLL